MRNSDASPQETSLPGWSRGDTLLPARTPEGILYSLHPAGLPARLLAYSTDFCIQGFLYLGILLFASTAAGITGEWIFLLLFFFLQWFYHILSDIFLRGASAGKHLLGLRVVMEDGTPVTPGASFLRNILRAADSFFFLYLIGLITHLASPGFRRLGDWAAGTLVVYKESELPLPQADGLPPLRNRPSAAPSRPLAPREKEILLRFCERYPLLGKARADEIAAPWVSRLTQDTEARDSPSDYLLSLRASAGGPQ